ncbi:MAG: NAD+ synthase [Halobacteria archaeon]
MKTVETEKARDVTSAFLENMVEEAGADGVVVGLSGGIDSSTAVSLAVDVLGPEKVQGLVMPSEVTTDQNLRDATDLAEDLGIDHDVISIDPIVDRFVESLSGVQDTEAIGNLRARSRMVLEYYQANRENLLVLGTGNRSELLIGYFTKYGDGAVDISPLAGLYKTEVRELARDLGVDEYLIQKQPTAGLWEGQTDEDELGASYEVIDKVLFCIADKGLSVDETAETTGTDQELVEKFKKMYLASEHKRTTPEYPEFDRD